MPNPRPNAANGGKPTKGFVKGRAYNPNGSSERVRKLGMIKRLTIDELAEVGTLILRNSREELEELKLDPNTSILQFWIVSMIVTSIKKGDAATFEVLMNRLIGKVPEHPITRELLEFSERREKGEL